MELKIFLPRFLSRIARQVHGFPHFRVRHICRILCCGLRRTLPPLQRVPCLQTSPLSVYEFCMCGGMQQVWPRRDRQAGFLGPALVAATAFTNVELAATFAEPPTFPSTGTILPGSSTVVKLGSQNSGCVIASLLTPLGYAEIHGRVGRRCDSWRLPTLSPCCTG